MDLARTWPFLGAAVSVSVAVSLAACAGSKSGPEEASVSAALTAGDIGGCNFGSTQYLLPSLGNGTPSGFVANGGHTDAGAASVSCRVHKNGDGTVSFAVSASTEYWGVSITAENATPTSPISGVAASFSWAQPGSLTSAPLQYNGSNCTVSWPSNLGIIAGGIGGLLTCNEMQLAGGTVTTYLDGGTGPDVCGGTANFVFQGCEQ